MQKTTLKLSSNMIGNNTDETYFSHALSPTDRQDSKPCKAFVYNSSANKNWWKT